MNFCSYIFPLISINAKEKLDKRFRKNTIRKNYYFWFPVAANAVEAIAENVEEKQ